MTWLSDASKLVTIFFALLAAVAYLRKKERRSSLLFLGVEWSRVSLAETLVGFGVALVLVSVTFLAEILLGAVGVSAAAGPHFGSLFDLLGLLAGVAFIEELVFRVLLLQGLAVVVQRVGTRVVLSAILFALLHAGNSHFSWLALLGNGIGGAIYAMAYCGTSRIWLPWSLHFGWNLFLGPVFGFSVSGLRMGGLLDIEATGAAWVTGGSYGPEAGIIGLLVRSLALTGFVMWFNQRRRRESSHAQGTSSATAF